MYNVCDFIQDVSDGGITTDTFPFNYLGVNSAGAMSFDCATSDAKTPDTCAWAAIEVGGTWMNATVTASGSTVTLTAPPGSTGDVTASS
jgi:hypothetical protein